MLDLGVTILQKPDFNEYIQLVLHANRGSLPTYKITDTMGWIDDYSKFIPFEHDIAYNENCDYTGAYNQIVAPKGDYESWLRVVKELRQNEPVVARIALAVSFASVLIGPLTAQTFVTYLEGSGGYGKTTIMRVAASVWGNPIQSAGPGANSYVQTMDTTENAIMAKAAFCGDLPLFLDERQSTKLTDRQIE